MKLLSRYQAVELDSPMQLALCLLCVVAAVPVNSMVVRAEVMVISELVAAQMAVLEENRLRGLSVSAFHRLGQARMAR